MKVGIVTINGNENYGNILQNYAVQEVLKEVGAEAETILNVTQYGDCAKRAPKGNKFTPSYIKKYAISQLNYRYNIKNSNQGLVKLIIFYKKHKKEIEIIKEKRKQNFIAFKDEYIAHSKYVLDINKEWLPEQVDEYSCFVSGSDQVWNPTYPSTSSINFLQFAPKEKRVALSPSFGINKIPEELRDKYAEWLESIPYLSVREEQGKKIIKELTGRTAKVLCDPTMAISQSNWIAIEKKPDFLKTSEYILTYFLGDKNNEYDQFIKSIAQKENLEVINLFDITDIQAYSTSPQEFLYLIHHARLVCTDSFHGAVFSIIMNSAFITFSRKEAGNSMESRMKTLLAVFKLENRDYRKVDISHIFNMDFSHTYDILESRSKEMMLFLQKALRGNKTENINLDDNAVDQNIFSSKDQCFGCSACAMACPKHCIEMRPDEEGFLYPNINNSLCINCGKCRTVCPVLKNNNLDNNPDCYIAFSNNKEIRKQSSSGGIFTELAKKELARGGIVYGAGFNKLFDVVHKAALCEEDLASLRGSKYVQSQMNRTYEEVKNRIEEGRTVYFSGTPCQVAGLYSYLGCRPDKLTTQDFICHGVPSPLVWEKYLKTFGNVKKVEFRSKKYGWHYFSLHIETVRKGYYKRLDEDFYLKLFLNNTILRPICYACPIKAVGSNADITLADCWSLDQITKEIADTDEGLSLIIANTLLGKQYVEELKDSGNITGVKSGKYGKSIGQSIGS